MNRGLKRFFIICVCVLGAGVILAVAGAAMGGVNSINKLADEYKWGHYISNDNIIPMHLEEGAEFDSIELEGPMDVNIVEGSQGSYINYDPGTCTPTLDIENGALKVNSNFDEDNGVFDFDFDSDNMPVLYIYVPEGTNLTSITGSIDLGDIDIHGVTATAINLSADLGDIDVDNVAVTSLNLEVNLGDVDIVMPLTEDQYALTADISLGDLSINDHDYSGVDKHFTTGSGSNRINISVDTGDIDVNFGGFDHDYED